RSLSGRARRSARRRDQLLDLLRNRPAHPGRSLGMGGLRLARGGRRSLRPLEHPARRARLLPAAFARLPSAARHPTFSWLARPGERPLALDGAALLARRGARRAKAEPESHRTAESGVAAH